MFFVTLYSLTPLFASRNVICFSLVFESVLSLIKNYYASESDIVASRQRPRSYSVETWVDTAPPSPDGT